MEVATSGVVLIMGVVTEGLEGWGAAEVGLLDGGSCSGLVEAGGG